LCPIEPGTFDLVTAREVLHHIENAEAEVTNMVANLRPGGALLSIELDFLPV
jgi:2-polyprenyl-3-methyl-5-hydroxy-6-metoxy-1,4-benzoquinol methylase